MWNSICSEITWKTNLCQFFAVFHWATPGTFTRKVQGEQSCKSSFLQLLTKETSSYVFISLLITKNGCLLQ